MVHQPSSHSRESQGTSLHSGGWSFDADGRQFKLVMEAHRIRQAHLYDPFMAIHTSHIVPLPHQITAVYDEMLTRKPLRFLLADDPGAGKTIMAGLLLKEMLTRDDVQRCLIVVPGSLVEQWHGELLSKFGLEFKVLTGTGRSDARRSNPFDENPLMLARLDVLSRNPHFQSWLKQTPEWDLVICDEAHRMSATYFGQKIRKTKRYQLGELLSRRSRYFLLMTATPHNGKDEEFQLFMALLDPDRFGGFHKKGRPRLKPTDLMRRMAKEDLLTFKGTPLFPERRAYTAKYELSTQEKALYESVTNYVREEMNRADRLSETADHRAQTVGFALQILQRRLASSPKALYESIRRRHQRLTTLLHRVSNQSLPDWRDGTWPSQDGFSPVDLEEVPEKERERVEDALLNRATAAATAKELQTEITVLDQLQRDAYRLLQSGTDAKWRQLASILEDPIVLGDGKRRKLIVFTEARDTLDYLLARIQTLLGSGEATVAIHGGLTNRARKQVVAQFVHDEEVQVLVATDAAGEGVNLQSAHLMVNYDLPWNPNRLEQRFGRIHRIGQTEVCHLWNLVAKDTREGEVYARLLEKLELARKTLGGRVYDVLGQVFDAHPLHKLMVEAIRYGEQPHVRDQVQKNLDAAVSQSRLAEVFDNQALVQNAMDADQMITIQAYLDRARATRMQPFNIQAFFLEAFRALGGSLHERKRGIWEITYVPTPIRKAQKRDAASSWSPDFRGHVCFDKDLKTASTGKAVLLGPGQDIFDVTVECILKRHPDILQRGSILVDPTGNDSIRVLFLMELAVQNGTHTRDGQPRVLSRKSLFVEVTLEGACSLSGPAPHLDYQPIAEAAIGQLQKELPSIWPRKHLQTRAMDFAREHLIPSYLEEVCAQRQKIINLSEQEISQNLFQNITYWDTLASQAKAQEQAGQTPLFSSRQATQRADELQARKRRRSREFALERQISAQEPRIEGVALVIPQGYLDKDNLIPNGQSRAAVEAAAMQEVMVAEQALGNQPCDVSTKKLGYDIESICAQTKTRRFIEVKGRSAGASDITVTANEIRTALNEPARFILAVVMVNNDGVADQPLYIRRPFQNTPDPALRSSKYSLGALMRTATSPY